MPDQGEKQGESGQEFAALLTGGTAGTGNTNPSETTVSVTGTDTSPAKPAAKPAADEKKKESESEPSGFDALPEETKAEIRKLRAENADRRKTNETLQAQVDEIADKDKTEAQKAEAKATRAEARAKEAEAKLLRYEVAAAKKIPAEAVVLMTADTREDLEAQADKILALAKEAQEKATSFDGGARENAEGSDPASDHNKLLIDALTDRSVS